jgi:hypothetical protein
VVTERVCPLLEYEDIWTKSSTPHHSSSNYFHIQIPSSVLVSEHNIESGPSMVEKIVPGPSLGVVSFNIPFVMAEGDPYFIMISKDF